MDGYLVKKRSRIFKKDYLPGTILEKGAAPPDLISLLIKGGYVSELTGGEDTGKADNASKSAKAIIDAATAEAERIKAEAQTQADELIKNAQEAFVMPSEEHFAMLEGIPPSDIVIPITTKNGLLELAVSPDDIVAATSILQLNAIEAAEAVKGVDKEEVLILVDALDSRATVKKAIAAVVAEKDEPDGRNPEGGV